MCRFTLPDGYKIFVTHFRRFEGEEAFMTSYDAKTEGFGTPTHNGGATEAVIVDTQGEPIAIGLSMCSSRDNFNKKIGRNIAVGRAMKNLNYKILL